MLCEGKGREATHRWSRDLDSAGQRALPVIPPLTPKTYTSFPSHIEPLSYYCHVFHASSGLSTVPQILRKRVGRSHHLFRSLFATFFATQTLSAEFSPSTRYDLRPLQSIFFMLYHSGVSGSEGLSLCCSTAGE